MENPDSRQASSGFIGEQLHLIDPPPFSPIFPSATTLTGVALSLFLQGRRITTFNFQDLTGSQRLAVFVGLLIHQYGWPIESVDVAHPDRPSRTISKYFLAAWALRSMGGARE